jgi:hypothetical protein
MNTEMNSAVMIQDDKCPKCDEKYSGLQLIRTDNKPVCIYCPREAEDDDTNRNITIYILSDGETWGMEGENRKATEEDVEKWGENYNIELGDWIGVVNDEEFLTGKSVATLLVTANELEELNEGRKVRHLDDYYERLEEEEEEEEENEWEQSYACDEIMSKSFVMAGGSAGWWNYIVEFHNENEQKNVYIENKTGRTHCLHKKLIISYDDEKQDKVRLVDKSYELKEDEEFVSY